MERDCQLTYSAGRRINRIDKQYLNVSGVFFIVKLYSLCRWIGVFTGFQVLLCLQVLDCENLQSPFVDCPNSMDCVGISPTCIPVAWLGDDQLPQPMVHSALLPCRGVPLCALRLLVLVLLFFFFFRFVLFFFPNKCIYGGLCIIRLGQHTSPCVRDDC